MVLRNEVPQNFQSQGYQIHGCLMDTEYLLVILCKAENVYFPPTIYFENSQPTEKLKEYYNETFNFSEHSHSFHLC